MSSNKLTEQMLNPGLAVFLRPIDFPERWTKWICGAGFAEPVAGEHYFVTLKRIGSIVLMTPAFSSPKPYRFEVMDKSGHIGWVARRTFFDPCQVLVAPIPAVIDSAIRAGDMSRPGCRNRVGPAGLTTMLEVIRAHAAAADGRSRDGAA